MRFPRPAALTDVWSPVTDGQTILCAAVVSLTKSTNTLSTLWRSAVTFSWRTYALPARHVTSISPTLHSVVMLRHRLVAVVHGERLRLARRPRPQEPLVNSFMQRR
jgi:hypothetical protein